jgi:hypothetical protein
MSLKEVNYLFPLYLYQNPNHTDDRRLNLSSEFVSDLTARLGLSFVPDGTGNLHETTGPEDVFHYIYAVLHAPGYRTRYAEFLRSDFPRVPLTSNRALFRMLCGYGAELTDLHLMDADMPLITRFPVPGDNRVEKVLYSEAEGGRVWINRGQYFEGVLPDVWNFHVGGYQVCEKWLKDRKERQLSYDDITHYQKIVAALFRTGDLMRTIDAAIDQYGGWPLT